MVINSKQILHAPVRTRSGTAVGKVASIDFDADTGHFTTLHVRVAGVVSGLLDKETLVGWQQIVSMSETEVIVEDTSVSRALPRFAKQFSSPTPAPRPTALHGKMP